MMKDFLLNWLKLPKNTDWKSSKKGTVFGETSITTVQVMIIVHPGGKGAEVLTYIGYIGMCGAKGYGFFSRFDLNYGINFGHFGRK